MLNWSRRPIRCDWISIFFIFCFKKIHFTPLDLEIYQFSGWFLQYYTLPPCTFGVKRIEPFHHHSLLMYVAHVIRFENTYKPTSSQSQPPKGGRGPEIGRRVLRDQEGLAYSRPRARGPFSLGCWTAWFYVPFIPKTSRRLIRAQLLAPLSTNSL